MESSFEDLEDLKRNPLSRKHRRSTSNNDPRSRNTIPKPFPTVEQFTGESAGTQRSQATQDDFMLAKSKRSNTIASLSDDGNQDKYRKEINDKIMVNRNIIDRLKMQCIEDLRQRGKESVSSEDCVENETVFKFMKYQQRVRHMRVMWLKTFTKAKAGVQVL